MQIDSHAPQGAKPFYTQLYVQVLAAITAGILLGHFYPDIGASLKPLGDAFVKLVKMIIAPVIFLTVATGIAGMSDMKKVGRVAGKAMLYFFTFSTLALVVGLVVANLVQPGAGMNIDPATLDATAVAKYADQAHESTIAGFLMGTFRYDWGSVVGGVRVEHIKNEGRAIATIVPRLDDDVCARCTARVFDECAMRPGALPDPSI